MILPIQINVIISGLMKQGPFSNVTWFKAVNDSVCVGQMSRCLLVQLQREGGREMWHEAFIFINNVFTAQNTRI